MKYCRCGRNLFRRNSDDDLRQLERQWRLSGSEIDKTRYITALRRAGQKKKAREITQETCPHAETICIESGGGNYEDTYGILALVCVKCEKILQQYTWPGWENPEMPDWCEHPKPDYPVWSHLFRSHRPRYPGDPDPLD